MPEDIGELHLSGFCVVSFQLLGDCDVEALVVSSCWGVTTCTVYDFTLRLLLRLLLLLQLLLLLPLLLLLLLLLLLVVLNATCPPPKA